MNLKITALLGLIIIAIISILQFDTTKESEKKIINKKVKIGIYEGDTSGLILLAKEKGFFKENGLDVELKYYSSGKIAVDAMLKGEVDYSNAAEFVIVKNSFKRKDFKIIASIAEANINGMLAKKSNGILDKSDIVNRTIGVSIGTAAEYYLGVFLEENGFKLDDVNIIDTHPLKIQENLINDKVDAIFSWEPQIYNIRKKYPNNITYFPMTNGFPFYFLLVVNEKIHKNNPFISENILKALKKSELWTLENKEEFRLFLKNKFDLREDYSKYTLNKHSFELTLPYSLTTVMNNEVSWLIENKLVQKKEIDVFDLIDTSSLKKVDSSSVTIIE